MNKRPVINKGDYLEVTLSGGEVALIDLEFCDVARRYSWGSYYKGNKIYAKRGNSSKESRRYLHHFILPQKQGFIVDHKDGNSLDSRLNNLRYVTYAQNSHNRHIASNNKSGYKGVYFDKETGKWRANIRFNSKLTALGRFKTVEEAAEAYNRAAINLFGEYAILNVICGHGSA